MSNRRFALLFTLTLAALSLAAPAVALADDAPASAVAEVQAAGSAVDFQPLVDAESYVLSVAGPDGVVHRREFAAGKTPRFAIGKRGDGVYTWELVATPRVDAGLRRDLEAARRRNDPQRERELMATGGMPRPFPAQSGSFRVAGGQIVAAGLEELVRATENLITATAADQVIPDDLIVQGSACVGLDCINGENFGFDTIRLKENNTRIQFDDTSTTAGFPTNNWQIRANSSSSGGASFLAFVDQGATANSESGTIVFEVDAGAGANALRVASSGNVGLGTGTPVLDLHINNANTPAIRLEQNSGGGFTAQTWDIAGNEANFFVRDVTSGSRLPLRIRPGAPSSSLDISADGDVGLGTGAPRSKLDIDEGVISIGDSNAGAPHTIGDRPGAVDDLQATGRRNIIFNVDSDNNSTNASFSVSRDGNPNLVSFVTREDFLNGFNRQTPSFPLHVGSDATNGNGAHVTAAGVWTNGSSRRNKENIEALSAGEAMAALAGLSPVRYTGVNSPDGEEYVGFIAEDVPDLVAMNDRASLSAMDLVAVLTKVVQEQQQTIEALEARLANLEATRAAAPQDE
jgi:hypothetical protein